MRVLLYPCQINWASSPGENVVNANCYYVMYIHDLNSIFCY